MSRTMIAAQTLINDDELERYAASVQAFLAGDIDAERFQSMRLQQGIYGQRQEGVNMVRIKVPGGRLNAAQAHTIADVLTQHSTGHTAHITTRQSIQIHHIPLADTPTALRLLAAAGLTTREACNNTVRNITACPLAGVCPAEHTDIGVFLEQAATHFLRHPLTQHLPRKFKISFSGCEQDCAQGMFHDLAVVAVRHDNRSGFKILAGGGLGHKPREAIVIEPFVEPPQLLACMEAVIAVHNHFSNRKLRAKSRIKFLIERFGSDGFIKKYRAELYRTQAALAGKTSATGHWHEDTASIAADPGAPRHILAQKQSGLNIIPIHISIGDITATQLHGLANILINNGLDELRTTQDQNLMIVNIADDKVPLILSALKPLRLDLPERGSNVAACPGTTTCRLGITSSMELGSKLSGGENDLRLRISGCHNGCAQPESADIGMYGEGKRLYNKLIPHYQLYIGGDGRGGFGLGFKSRSIPSARIEDAIADIQNRYHDSREANDNFYHWSQRQGQNYFDDLLSVHATVTEDDIPQLGKDHGDDTEFHVLQLGGGECAGAAQETVAALFADARNETSYRDAFLSQQKHNESLACAEQALRLVGNALLFVAAQSPLHELIEIARQIKESLGEHAAMGQTLEQFATTLGRLYNHYDDDVYAQLITDINQWADQAAALCQDIDQQLDLSASLGKPDAAATEIIVVDLSSYGCPLHYIKARNILRQHRQGDIVKFIFSSGDPVRQASSSLEGDGHEILAREEQGITTSVTIRKAGEGLRT